MCVTASPEWIVKPQDTHIEEGQPGYLHCHAQGTPEPRVTWYRKSVPISEEVNTVIMVSSLVSVSGFSLSLCLQGSRYKLFSNGTLRINSAEVNDGQMYSCTCVTEGGSITAHARIHILGEMNLLCVSLRVCIHPYNDSKSDALKADSVTSTR